jgi:hypothetical protein
MRSWQAGKKGISTQYGLTFSATPVDTGLFWAVHSLEGTLRWHDVSAIYVVRKGRHLHFGVPQSGLMDMAAFENAAYRAIVENLRIGNWISEPGFETAKSVPEFEDFAIDEEGRGLKCIWNKSAVTEMQRFPSVIVVCESEPFTREAVCGTKETGNLMVSRIAEGDSASIIYASSVLRRAHTALQTILSTFFWNAVAVKKYTSDARGKIKRKSNTYPPCRRIGNSTRYSWLKWSCALVLGKTSAERHGEGKFFGSADLHFRISGSESMDMSPFEYTADRSIVQDLRICERVSKTGLDTT